MGTSESNKPIVINSRVMIELVDGNGGLERCTFAIVPAKQADYKAGLLGEDTPLGRTLLGRRAGETVPYHAGDLRAVRILSVSVPDGSVPSDAADKRRAAVQEAANQSEIINQLIFATARGSKWGEYDVDVDRLLGDDRQDS